MIEQKCFIMAFMNMLAFHYIIIASYDPRVGELDPCLNGGLNAWLNECQLLEISEETQKWADENSDSTQSKYNEYYKDWMEKEAATRPVLLIEDGK